MELKRNSASSSVSWVPSMVDQPPVVPPPPSSPPSSQPDAGKLKPSERRRPRLRPSVSFSFSAEDVKSIHRDSDPPTPPPPPTNAPQRRMLRAASVRAIRTHRSSSAPVGDRHTSSSAAVSVSARLFPMALRAPTPDDRMAARARTHVLWTPLLYAGFFLSPIAVCYASVATGPAFGFSAYRMLVSWLFWFCLQVLMVDPFVVRYRTQLVDFVSHWAELRSCTRSLLLVYFDRNVLYYLLLAATAYAFVLLEAVLDLFAGRDAALRSTSALYWVTCALIILIWMDRLIRSHSRVILSSTSHASSSSSHDSHPTAATTTTGNAATLAADGTVSVSLRDDPRLPNVSVIIPPAAYLSPPPPPETKSRLNATLRTQGCALVVEGNTARVEATTTDVAGDNDDRDKTPWMRKLLFVACAAAIVVPAVEQGGWIALQGPSVWIVYGILALCAGSAVVCIYRDGKRYMDRTYLQFVQLFGTFFPMVVGGWLLSSYRTYASDRESIGWTYGIMMTQLILSHVYLSVTSMSVSNLAAPFTYARLMFLPQLCLYGFQYFVFGLTQWSSTYVALVVLANVHNLLSSTSSYGRLYAVCRSHTGGGGATVKEAVPLFGSLLSTAHDMELFGQDVLADLVSFLTVTALAGLDAVIGSRIGASVLPQFPNDHLWQRATLVVALRACSWLCARALFRRSLQQLEQNAVGMRPGTSMRNLLDKYLGALNLPVYKSIALIQVYEHAVPEMLGNFTITGDMAAFHTADTRRRNVDSLMNRHAGKSIAAYVLYWRSLVHPSILKRHAVYFICCFLLILFVVLQPPDSELPLRYAWYRASESPSPIHIYYNTSIHT